jgi:capsular polysaccharide biosynthesis protein
VNDRDQAATLSLSQSADQPGRLWDFGDPSNEDRSAAELTTGLTSLGFIRAALRRSARLWCATAVIGLLAGFGVLKALPPAYQASTSVLLASNPFELASDAALNDQAIAQSRTVAGAALRKLGLQQSAASFVGDYTVTILTNQVLLITVKATSSDQAVREANALATAFLTVQAQQLRSQERLVNAALQQQVTLARQRINQLSNQISQLSAQPATPTQHAKLASLVNQRGRDTHELAVLKQANLTNQANTRIDTTKVIQGSQVLDPAVPSRYSTKKYLVVYVGTGLIAGVAIGMFIVVVRALVSDRLRRRDDVARALGAPVKLSVGKIRLSRWRPGSRGLAAAQRTDTRRIVAHLGRVAHLGSAGSARSPGVATLAVVPVDEPQVAALALVSLAVSAAQQGLHVVVADLCGSSPAGRLLEITDPGVHLVGVDHAQLIVAIPDHDDVVPAGPLDRASPEAQRSAFTGEVGAAAAEADLLLTLTTLEPSLGAEHLAGWAHGAVAVVTAGRSSADRVHAVGEMIRLSGTELISAVLVGADKVDESLGVPDLPGLPASSVGPGPGS